jgi:hypothetical protein
VYKGRYKGPRYILGYLYIDIYIFTSSLIIFVSLYHLEIYYMELAGMIMEAKKSLDLLPAPWGPGKPGCNSTLNPKALELGVLT